MKENLHFPAELRRLMDQLGVNNSELGAAIGLSHVAIGNFLGGQLPKSEHLAELADFFGVTMDSLLGRKIIAGSTNIAEAALSGFQEEAAAAVAVLQRAAAELRIKARILEENAARLESEAAALGGTPFPGSDAEAVNLLSTQVHYGGKPTQRSRQFQSSRTTEEPKK